MDNSNRVVYDLTFTEDSFDDLPFDQRLDNIVKLLVIVSDRLDAAQKETISLAYNRLLDNASGDILDGVASRFFIERSGKEDVELKAALQLFALRQTSEGTRDQIVKLLNVIAGEGGYIKIYKGDKKYLQVTVPTDCLDLTKVKVDLENLFPINTNLVFLKSNVIRKPFGVTSRIKPEVNSDKIGKLGSRLDSTFESNYTAVTIINNERGIK